MPSDTKVINMILRLTDEMSGTLNKSANSLKNMGDSLTSFGQKMTLGITVPLVAAGAAMMNSFMEFDSVMAELEARTGSTAEEMKKMQEFAIEMGRTTAFSATEAAQALLELTSSGSSAAEAMKQLPAVLDLAAAGALDLGRAADGVTDILAQFQLEAEESAMVADQLAKAAGASSATVEDLLQAFANAGPVMSQFGLSVEESAAALAVMAENGIKGAEAGTQLKSMLLNMSRDTDTVAAAWETLGVSMFDAEGNMRNIDDIFKDINKAMEGMSMEEQVRLSQDLAGSYGLVGFNALRASNGISDMQGAMSSAAGASAVADARMNTLAGQLDQLMGSLETLGIVLGGLAEGPLTTLVAWLTDVVNAITAWVQQNPQLAQFVLIILAIVAAVGPLLMMIGAMASGWAAIAAIIPVVATAFTAIMALGAPLIALIALIIAAIVLLVTNWEQLGTTLSQLATIIDHVFWNVFSKARDSLIMLGTAIFETAKSFANGFFEMGAAIIDGLINGIKSKAVELIAYIFGLSKDMENAIKQALGIHSPSQVFMEMGENVALGFQKGVSGLGSGIGVNVPQTASTMAGSRPMLAGASAGGGNVVQNYYIQAAPGTTGEQVKDIAKQLGKITKRKSGGLLGNGR